MNLSKELSITEAVYAEFFFYCKVIRYSIVERTGASSDAAELEPGYSIRPQLALVRRSAECKLAIIVLA